VKGSLEKLVFIFLIVAYAIVFFTASPLVMQGDISHFQLSSVIASYAFLALWLISLFVFKSKALRWFAFCYWALNAAVTVVSFVDLYYPNSITQILFQYGWHYLVTPLLPACLTITITGNAGEFALYMIGIFFFVLFAIRATKKIPKPKLSKKVAQDTLTNPDLLK